MAYYRREEDRITKLWAPDDEDDRPARKTNHVRLPDGVTAVKPQPKGGWKLDITRVKLAKPLESGSTITITLVFANAGEKMVDVPVREDAP